MGSLHHAGGPYLTPTTFTSDFWSPIIATAYLLSIMALSAMLAKRLPSWGSWSATPPARLAVVVLLADSLAFVFTAALFTLGIGTSRNSKTCGIAIWTCIGFYGSTKLFITVFLIERLHMVQGMFTKRRESKLYRANVLLAFGWIGVFVTLICIHRTIIRPDNQCVFTLEPNTLYAAAGLDIVLNLYFSILFAIPLWRGAFANQAIRRIAIKSLVGAGVSMASSVTNLVVTSSLHGSEFSWVCLVSCTLDVVVNAVTLYFITNAETSADVTGSATRSAFPPVTGMQSYAIPETLSTDPRLIEYRRSSRMSKAMATLSDASSLEGGEGPTGGAEAMSVAGEKAWGELRNDPRTWRGDSGVASSISGT